MDEEQSKWHGGEKGSRRPSSPSATGKDERPPIWIWHELLVGEGGLPAVWGLVLFLVIAYSIWIFAGSMLMSTPTIYDMTRAASGKPMIVFSILMNDGLPLCALVIATWILSRIERRRVGMYGLGGTHKLGNFLAGLGWGLLFLSFFVMVLRWAGLLVIDGRFLYGSAVWKNGLAWLAGFLLVGLFEEYSLRGYLQFTLTRGLRTVYESIFKTLHAETMAFWTSAAILSFFFGYGHRSNAGESTVGLVAAGFIGMIFCLTLWKTGSLWWALGFHASWDWAQSFVFGVADSGTMVQGHLYASHPVGEVILSGGETGPEGSALVLPLLAVVVVVIYVTLPGRRWSIEGAGDSGRPGLKPHHTDGVVPG